MSDDIARVVGLDVRPVNELHDEEVFVKSLPVISSAEITVLRGLGASKSGATAVRGGAAKRSTELPAPSNDILPVEHLPTSTTAVTAAVSNTADTDISTGGRPKKKQRKQKGDGQANS